MKKAVMFIIAIMIIGTLSACTESVRIRGVQFAEFENLFINGIPKEVENDTICHDVYIEQSKSVFGDPNYVISFSLRFDDPLSFHNHIQGINFSSAKELKFDGKVHYLFQGSKEGLSEYTNTRVLDGYFFVFEIISVDTEIYEVNYLYAYVWDYWKDEFLISKLEEVFLPHGNKSSQIKMSNEGATELTVKSN